MSEYTPCVYLYAIMLEVALFFFFNESLLVIPLFGHLFSYHEQYQPVGSTEFLGELVVMQFEILEFLKAALC